MPEIVFVRVDDVGSGIGLDQRPVVLAGLSEESPIGLAVLHDTDMAPGDSWIDAVRIFPIRGDSHALPVGGLIFNRA